MLRTLGAQKTPCQGGSGGKVTGKKKKKKKKKKKTNKIHINIKILKMFGLLGGVNTYKGLGPSPPPDVRDMGARGLTPVTQNRWPSGAKPRAPMSRTPGEGLGPSPRFLIVASALD